jgi:hypothetical protein
MSRRNKRQRDTTDSGDPDEDEARQEADQLRQNILDYSADECADHLAHLTSQWKIETPPENFMDIITMAFDNLGSDIHGTVVDDDIGSYGLKEVEKKIRLAEFEALTLCARMKELEMMQESDQGSRMLKVLEVLFYCRKIIVAMYRTKITYHDNMVVDDTIEENLLGSWHLRFRWGSDKLKEGQQLLLYLLDVCMERRYRKHGDSLFEPLVIDGQKTYAWKRVGTIKNFIFQECQKEIQFDAFMQLTSSNRMWKQMEEHLESCADYQLPTLVKNRNFFSFKNGIYDARNDTFWTYDQAYRHVSDSIVSSKYFDLMVPDDVNDYQWNDIDTPHIDGILKYQGFEGDCLQWFYVMVVGRMLYNVGDRDNWQVFPYLLGLAGTGKSTIVHEIVAKLYSVEDVGVLSNNSEKTFGLAAIYDKILFVAGEIKRDLALDQTEFQSLVSGEAMSINEKYKTAFSIQNWKVPGIMAGNELPSFSDNAGSIARRLVVFRFDKKVQRGDTKLSEKLHGEMAKILIKCNKAYIEASTQYGDRDVWDVIPKSFVESRDKSMAMLSLLDSFMRQPFVVLQPDLFMPMREFHIAIRAYALESGFDGPRPSQENLITSLGKFGVTSTRCLKNVRGRDVMDDYILGMALRDNTVEDEDEPKDTRGL